MTLEERIQRLEDIEAIRYLQAKYQRCLDSRDFNGIAECFADDVISGYGNGEMAFNGKDNVLKFLMGSMSMEMPSAHMIHGGEIDILSADKATAKWYLEDFLYVKGYNINIAGTAIYQNTYVKKEGKWLISEIGYKRGYEYKDGVSQTQAGTFSKTTFIDEIANKSVEDFTDYNKMFKQMSLNTEKK